jgi:hypothetical protein
MASLRRNPHPVPPELLLLDESFRRTWRDRAREFAEPHHTAPRLLVGRWWVTAWFAPGWLQAGVSVEPRRLDVKVPFLQLRFIRRP